MGDGFWLTPDGIYYSGGQLDWQDIAVPERPTADYVWEWETSQWTLPITTAKSNQRTIIKSACAAAIDGGFDYQGSRYQSDIVSRSAITDRMALIAAGVAVPAGFVWRTADNVNTTMDASDFTGLSQAMVAHVYSQRTKSWSLIEAIDAATTRAAVEAIVW